MTSTTRNVRIEVGPDHFALLADAMCLCSKNTAKFQSFRATVQHACRSVAELDLSPQDLAAFLASTSPGNTIALWLEVKSDWMADFDNARAKVAKINGKPVHDRLAIPFIVGQAIPKNAL